MTDGGGGGGGGGGDYDDDDDDDDDDLHSFAVEDSSRIAPRCRNM